MSVEKKVYIVFGIKLDKPFTKKRCFMDDDLFSEMEWDKDKPKDKPFFITDGMNGLYTFFGFVQVLNDGGYDFEEEITEIKNDFCASDVIDAFKNLYPEMIINECDIKLYYLPHFV